MKTIFTLVLLFTFNIFAQIFPMEKGTVYYFNSIEDKQLLFYDSVKFEQLDSIKNLSNHVYPIWHLSRITQNKYIQEVMFYDPSPNQLIIWNYNSYGATSLSEYYKVSPNKRMTIFVIIDTISRTYGYDMARFDDTLQTKMIAPSYIGKDSSFSQELDFHNSPKYKHTVVPGLGVVKVEYDRAEWCVAPCKFPFVQDTSLLSYKMNPEYKDFYLRRIVKANGDTLFDYERDVISPVLPQKALDQSSGFKGGQWTLPHGFEVQKAERILANGKVQNLRFRLQNRVLILENVKDHNQMEWVRITPKSGVARTLRWE
jgi:hypothetical protein